MEQHDSIILILGLGVLLSFSIHGLPELELKERLHLVQSITSFGSLSMQK